MWSFPKAGPEHSNSSSKLNEFFNDHDAATGLVREAIQNSLDAALSPNEPVRVRFSLASISWSELKPFLKTGHADETLDSHLNSEDLGKFAATFKGKDLRCLIIEDSGTKGLIGETDKNNARSGSNFVGFWWNDGISGKGKGASGSHGVGKTTLTRISSMSLFLAVTKRSDDNRRFLLGFANLPYHRVSGASYLGYGRFGKAIPENGQETFMPIEDSGTIEDFLSAVSLQRDESGLSVFIPGVPKTVDSPALLLAVVRDYYWPILKGDLVVEVVDRLNGQQVLIKKENIGEVITDIGAVGEKYRRAVSDTASRVSVAREILGLRIGGNPNWYPGNTPKLNQSSNGNVKGEVTKECFSEENVQRILESYDDGKLVGFNFALDCKTADDKEQAGIVQVFFKKINHVTADNTQFIRNQIVISNQPSGFVAKNVMCFLVAEDQTMSDYLKEAEEPAHTRWYLNRFNDQRSYKSDWALRFVMDLPRQMFRILSREDEDAAAHENFADDIFSITQPAGSGPVKEKRGGKPDRSRKPSDIPETKRQPLIRLERDAENLGFAILPVTNMATLLEGEGLAFPIGISVKAAYVSALGRSRSWKDYRKFDFEFGKSIPIIVEPMDSVNVVEASENQFLIEILKPDFKISATGFDGNRDLLIHPKIIL
ncbi:hypothetical protein ACVDG9_23820 [Roseibium sp. RP-7]